MKIDVHLIIDIGQTHIKYYLVNVKNNQLLKNKIFNNNYFNKYKKYYSFNVNKFKINLYKYIYSCNTAYNIIKISSFSFGSTSFFVNENNKILPNITYNNISNKKLDNEYLSIIPPYEETITPLMDNFHNMGKQILMMSKIFKINKKFNLLSLSNLPVYLLNYNVGIDKSYLACHSHLFNFKKSELSSLSSSIIPFEIKIKKPFSNAGFMDSNLLNELKINCKTKISYGAHDTNASYYYHKKVFKNEIEVLCTGTWFIFLSEYIKMNFSKNNKDFFGNYSIQNKKVLSYRFPGGIYFAKYLNKNLNNKNLKEIFTLDYALINQSLKKYLNKIKNNNENIFKNINNIEKEIILSFILANKTNKNLNLINSKKNIVVDGYFAFNKYFIYFLSIYRNKQKIICYNDFNSGVEAFLPLLNNKKIIENKYTSISKNKFDELDIIHKINKVLN